MPTIIDATVVNQAYDTSGNGGRKLVRLSNGWLVAGVYDSTNSQIKFFVSQDNGQTFQQLCYVSGIISTISFALASKGTNVYLLATMLGPVMGFVKFDATTVTNTDLVSTKVNIDTGQSSLGGGASLAINDAGTELHAAWASKNSIYPYSFNIRYCKGTINADGSVMWGAVQQITKLNTSGDDVKNPTIVIYNGNPEIYAEIKVGTTYAIQGYKETGFPFAADSFRNWTFVNVYSVSSYTQSSPSACVDKNGRIWVAWQGKDATYTTYYNIRVSYSDDGGATWSSMQTLTTSTDSDKLNPSITVNRNNQVFVVYWSYNTTVDKQGIRKLKYNGSSWGSEIVVTNKLDKYPSVLNDSRLDFSEPIFIYQDNTNPKVGFYGTWIVTTISVTPGYIGQKTSADKSNILTYSITTDGTMSDITEKINGVTIATRTNPTSGQEFTVSLTQEQWDAIKYGNGHTLTIEMGSDKWTYTFDKRLNANDDILSAVKGVQDLQDHLNAVKAQLGSAIRANGGTVNDADAWSAFVSAISNLNMGKKWATGTGYPSSSFLTVTGLSFSPKTIIIHTDSSTGVGFAIVDIVNSPGGFYKYPTTLTPGLQWNTFDANNQVTSNGFTLFVPSGASLMRWVAFE